MPASVTARAVATLTARPTARLRRLAVEPGATVAKGEVLAVIDSPAAQKRLAEREGRPVRGERRVGGSGVVDLSGLQDGLDAAAADAFAAARSAAGKVADEKVRGRPAGPGRRGREAVRDGGGDPRALQRQVAAGRGRPRRRGRRARRGATGPGHRRPTTWRSPPWTR